jgi:hypothetical protein
VTLEVMSAVTLELDDPVCHEEVTNTAGPEHTIPLGVISLTDAGVSFVALSVVTPSDIYGRLKRRSCGITVVAPPRGYVMSTVAARTPECVTAVTAVPKDRRDKSHIPS